MTTHEASAIPETRSVRRVGPRPRREAGGGSTSSGGGAVYGLGMIGALVYFLGTAGNGQERVLALGKAVVWPALLVYRAFKVLPT